MLRTTLLSGMCSLLLLAACATSPELSSYRDWVDKTGWGQAEQGTLKWSAYYKECFARLLKVPAREEANKVATLEFYDTMIQHALDYESGRLDKIGFEDKRRHAQMDYVRSTHGESRSRVRSGFAGDIYPH